MKASKVIACAGALALLVGCVDNYVSVQVLGAKAFSVEFVEVDGDMYFMCELPDFGEPMQRTEGWIDFGDEGFAFVQPFELRNNLQGSCGDIGRVDSNDVILERMIISYRGLPERGDLTARLDDLETVSYLTATIDSAGGLLIAPLTLIPAHIGRIFQSEIVPNPGDVETIIATFSLEGRTNAGRAISTAAIDFPINVGFQSGICDDGRCACHQRSN